MNQILAIFILSGMVAIGHPFGATYGATYGSTCKRCWTLDSTKCCNEKTIVCERSKCMMLSEYCTINNVKYNTVKKTCAFEPLCGTCFSVSTKREFFLRVSGECREGVNSNAELKFNRICPDPLPHNGLQCTSCYLSNTTDGCDSTEKVKCGNNESQCVDYRGLVELSDGSRVPMSVKGCITEGGCDFGFSVLPGAKELQRRHMTCTKAEAVPSAGGN
ncbi:uncharacterized protein ACMZJ9_019319 [Mantella aurantiaca]